MLGSGFLGCLSSISIAAPILCSLLVDMAVHCQGARDTQTCFGVERKLESCLSGKSLTDFNEEELTVWLQCAGGHGPSLAIAGADLSELSVHEMADILELSLKDARVVHDLIARGRPLHETSEGCDVMGNQGTGTQDALHTFYQGARRGEEVPYLEARMANFERVVCGKCERRGVDCKCRDEDESPIILLREYAALYSHWIDFVKEYGNFVMDVQYVVVQVAEHEGLGNQMLKMITGLILAMSMKRALVVQPLTPDARSSLDPVINFFTEYPQLDSILVQLDNPQTLDSFMCEDISSVWGKHDVLILGNAMQALHIFLNNPHFGSSLRGAFLDLPVFFLSHFFW